MSTMEAMSLNDWEELPSDPDPSSDLGYEAADWDVVQASNGSGQLIFLPKDDEMLKEDAFIVAERDSVCDIRTRV